MELEMLYLKDEDGGPVDVPAYRYNLGSLRDRWITTHNSQQSWNNDPDSFTHSTVFINGIHVKGGRVQNPQDLVYVHKLCDEFRTAKYIRAKFFESQLFHEQT